MAIKADLEKQLQWVMKVEQMHVQELEDTKKRREDEALFILYKSKSETQPTEEQPAKPETKPETASIAQMIIHSNIDVIFGNTRMSHDELQKLLQKLDVLQVETKRRAMYEIVKCTKLEFETFTKIWNIWSRSAGTTSASSVIEIAFKYYEYVGVLCTWQRKENIIERYTGGYDEYQMCSLWSIYSDGKMYEKLDGGRRIRHDLREDAKARLMKQLSTEQNDLLIAYLICYPLSHDKTMYTFQNYGAEIAEFYALETELYKYDRYTLGKELFGFIKNELKIDFPNNFTS
eukprot:26315_1